MVTRTVDITIDGITNHKAAQNLQKHLADHHIDATIKHRSHRATITTHSPTDLSTALRSIRECGYTAHCHTPITEPSNTRHTAHALTATLIAAIVVTLTLLPSLQFTGWHWAAATLTAITTVVNSAPIHRTSLAALRNRTPPHTLPTSLAILGTWAWSGYLLATNTPTTGWQLTPGWPPLADTTALWSTNATLAATALWAHRLHHRTHHTLTTTLTALRSLPGHYATRHTPDEYHSIATTELTTGDTVLVPTGAPIPCDGIITDGTSTITTEPVTTDPTPHHVSRGDTVYAGTRNLSHALHIEATATNHNTQLAQFIDLVETSIAHHHAGSRTNRTITLLAVPGLFALAALCATSWAALTNAATAVAATAAVLIIAMPTPYSPGTTPRTLRRITQAAARGIVWQPDRITTMPPDLNIALINRTGTITDGQHHVTHITTTHTWDDTNHLALSFAAAVAEPTNHPISTAITNHAIDQHIAPPHAEGHVATPGFGSRGNITGHRVQLGNTTWFADHTIPDDIADAIDDCHDRGETPTLLAVDNHIVACIATTDTIRDTTSKGIKKLTAKGITVALISGATTEVARHTGTTVGIHGIIGDTPNADKPDTIKHQQVHSNMHVVMIGDGVDDQLAMDQANLAISVGALGSLADKTQDITLLGHNMITTQYALATTRALRRSQTSTTRAAIGYHVVGLGAACAGILHPIAASVIVTTVSAVALAITGRTRRTHAVHPSDT